MANIKDAKQSLEPVVLRNFGGKDRTIQFDMNAFAELENKYGSIETAMEQLQKGRMADVRNVLWAGLIHEEAKVDEITGEVSGYKITAHQVGSWVKNPAMLAEITQELGKAMGNDMPDPSNMVGVTEAQPAELEVVPSNVASVVLTDEEKAAEALEAKNG